MIRMLGPMTPFARGVMPPGVLDWPDGPPDGRVELTFVAVCGGGHWVDQRTGAHFHVRHGVDCGAGCKCAAEARWDRHCAAPTAIPRDPDPGRRPVNTDAARRRLAQLAADWSGRTTTALARLRREQLVTLLQEWCDGFDDLQHAILAGDPLPSAWLDPTTGDGYPTWCTDCEWDVRPVNRRWVDAYGNAVCPHSRDGGHRTHRPVVDPTSLGSFLATTELIELDVATWTAPTAEWHQEITARLARARARVQLTAEQRDAVAAAARAACEAAGVTLDQPGGPQ